ncbi:hypothetical protein [Roseivirga echinicomitans]|uniref:DUF4221 domain-containing protein n=1 Tax=Roseivirga echinicomitans TaxID=296218 RepID=A0A150XDD6_9BACT|nr:hypothetical protein [Roseivirga echinicomitans]KYG76711.1 hypothetical protein AWN68_06705 [Roseivirga echinicomitans]
MRSHVIIYLSLFLLTCSCQTDDESKNYFNLESGSAPKTKLIRIDLDTLTPSRPHYIQHFESEGNSYLGWVNPILSAVQVYSLKNNKLVTKLSNLPLPLPDNSNLHFKKWLQPEVSAFFLWNGDIYTYPKNNYGGSLVYSTDRFQKQDSINLANGASLKSIDYTSNPLTVLNDKLYITVDPQIDFNLKVNPDNEFFWLKSIDLKTNEVDSIDIALPELYAAHLICPSSIIPSITINGEDNILISWPLSNEITSYNTRTKVFETIQLNLGVSLTTPNELEKIDVVNCNSFYENSYQIELIKFDSYKDYYYLICSLPSNSGANSKPYLLYTLDSKFKVISKIDLNPDTFYLQGLFVSKEGLSISTNHINNRNVNESYAEFMVFDF